MYIYFLENKTFAIGMINEVVDFLLRKNNKSKKTLIILPCSLHDLALDENFLYKNVDLFTSDSMILTYYFRFKLKKRIDRVYGPDLMLKILEKEQSNHYIKNHYFLAPNKETTYKLKNLLKKHHKTVDAGFGFLPKDSSRETEISVLQKIIKKKPDIVWLGIGSPKQIELASYLKNHSTGSKIFCVGAAFEFLTKQKKQAPRFLQNSGLEWLFRLLSEPKRLWRRYLVIIPKYLLLICWRKITAQGKK